MAKKIIKCPECKGRVEQVETSNGKVSWKCLDCGKRFEDPSLTCPDCGWDKLERYIDKEVEFYVCKTCDCTFLPDGDIVLDDDSVLVKSKNHWFPIMWISGVLLVVLHFIALVGIWGGIELDFGSSVVDMINSIRICGTVWCLLWIAYIYSSLMVHKERRDNQD